jgi:flagellar M-ring protein FliF
VKALQSILARFGQQARGLGPTGRLLGGALAVILAMALLLVWLYAGRSNMVTLPVSLTGQTRGDVISYLEQRGVRWAERGGQIVVPVEQKHLVLAGLTDQEIIAPDQIDFDQLVRQQSPFLSKAQNEKRWLVATMNELSRTVSRMKGIRRAVVVIDEPDRPSGLGAAARQPSASVTVETSGSPLGQEQVNAIAAMVAGAHAELGVERVEVIDAGAGRRFRAEPAESMEATRYLALQREHTRYYEEKVLKALAHIPGVNVAVNVIVNHRELVEQTRRFDDPKLGVMRESARSISSSTPVPGGEPGVRSNAGVSLGGAGRSAALSDERSETAMQPAFGGTDSHSRDPGGYPLKINASIGVPRLFFVGLYRDERGDPAAEPTAPELEALVAREVGRIQAHVQPLVDTGPTGGQALGTVAVSMISAPPPEAAGVEAGPGPAGGLLNETMVKYTSLGGLALLSLAMMLLMVRRAATQPHISDEGQDASPTGPALAMGGEILGDAPAAEVALEGLELDEATLRRRHMVEQINRMATARPEEAARILRGWIGTAER